jgi:hypothetical protein
VTRNSCSALDLLLYHNTRLPARLPPFLAPIRAGKGQSVLHPAASIPIRATRSAPHRATTGDQYGPELRATVHIKRPHDQ